VGKTRQWEKGAATVERKTDLQFVVDFDHHSDEAKHSSEGWNELRRGCPVAWNPRYGGYWMVTDYDNASRVSREGETFAHKYEPGAVDGVDYLGTGGIPRWPGRPPLGLQEEDGPRHAELRRALNPHFAARIIERDRPRMSEAAAWFLDQKIESGRMDFVNDYANPVPAVITLDRMGLPKENWALWSHTMHAVTAFPAGSPEQIEAAEAAKLLQEEMLQTALARRDDPRDDPTTVIARIRVDGELLSDFDIGRTMWTVTVGGLNTTTGLVSMAVRYLASHPDDRRRLVEDPDLYPRATEEFLRYFTPQRSNSRTVTQDIVLGGQQLRRGDQLLLCRWAADLDEKEFDRADAVVIDREVNKHLAFGLGVHRCLGSSVARIMVQVMLREFLERVPEFEIDEAAVVESNGSPGLAGISSMPICFTPAKRTGAADPFGARPSMSSSEGE
jgi:cytochrome P450